MGKFISCDIIRPFEKSLFVQFGSTGELQNMSTLRLDQGVTFSLDGNAIQARYHNTSEPFLVERFSSDSLASTAFQHLQATVKRYARYRRFAAFGKNVVKWGVAPVILVILALAMNLAVTRAVSENTAGQFGGQGAPMLPFPANPGTLRQPIALPSELAKAMADGVKAGKYSVQLSKGRKGTLYVFSDPSCSYCQDLEPELDKLAKDYTIHVFPVTVIGGQLSLYRVAKLLCVKPEARAALWKKVVDGNDPQGGVCVGGTAAVTANNQIFRVMRFVGTPTLINAAGETTPVSIPNTADAIHQWIAGSAAARK